MHLLYHPFHLRIGKPVDWVSQVCVPAQITHIHKHTATHHSPAWIRQPPPCTCAVFSDMTKTHGSFVPARRRDAFSLRGTTGGHAPTNGKRYHKDGCVWKNLHEKPKGKIGGRRGIQRLRHTMQRTDTGGRSVRPTDYHEQYNNVAADENTDIYIYIYKWVCILSQYFIRSRLTYVNDSWSLQPTTRQR